jgi:hypothetical protein
MKTATHEFTLAVLAVLRKRNAKILVHPRQISVDQLTFETLAVLD